VLLKNALASLPARCREVFTLRRLHGLSQREIANRLGISEKTVEAQNSLAMHKCVQFFAQRTRFDLVNARCAIPALTAAGTNPQHV
jgi:RNA polymerase sigma-70 factor (ECF subfamily)